MAKKTKYKGFDINCNTFIKPTIENGQLTLHFFGDVTFFNNADIALVINNNINIVAYSSIFSSEEKRLIKKSLQQ